MGTLPAVRALTVILVLAAAVVLVNGPVTPAHAIYGATSVEVDDARCEFSQPRNVTVCRAPSDLPVEMEGEAPSLAPNQEAPAGTPIRLVTPGFVQIGSTTIDDSGRWEIDSYPRVSGATRFAQAFVGGQWQTIEASTWTAEVFVELRGTQSAFGGGNPLTVFGRAEWYRRDGVGRVSLKRCRFRTASRCRSPRAYGRTIARKRLRGRGGAGYRFVTRSPLAYGRPLAVVYDPRKRFVSGDIVVIGRARS